MRKLKCTLLAAMFTLLCSIANATVADISVGGWFEGGYVTWTKEAGYAYNVYVRSTTESAWKQLDTELVREYGTYGRADAVGLKAGQYVFKVVPVQNNVEISADATETAAFTATAYDRGGFAHFKTASSTFDPSKGVGAYKNDGTLKEGAKVFYVTADNAKTITTKVQTGSKETNITECTGFQNIIDAYQKGYDKTPIDFRIIGTLKAADMDAFSSSAEGLQIKGKSAYSEMNITIEGIGKDATIHGFGFLIRNACSIELRNFAIMWCMDDAVSMDTDNSNLWIHNLDLFYGKPGGAADQKKGDGTLDIKGDSKYSTISYNHLWDSGKSSLCGMTSESGPNYLTYHHNWFDHSDSRHPRIRTMSVHVYNNYFDGNSKYGIGATTGSDVFAENNYFRNCKYPMLSSKQGSDVNNGVGTSDQTKGTFSGEAGGSIKAYGNIMTGQKSFEPYVEGHATYAKHFDAYVVENKSDKVPATVKALLGEDTYSNFDTDPSLMYSDYKVDAAADVPAIIKGELGAGRCQHGDFSWTFGANEDSNAEVIQALSDAINAYKSTLVGFFGKTISNGGASEEQGGGSNEGSGDSGSGSGTEDSGNDSTLEEEPYIGTADDYFFFNADNQTQVETYLADGTITLVNGTVAGSETSSFVPNYSYDAEANGKTFSSTVYTGSLQLAKASAAGATDGGSVIFRCKKGITTFAAYLYRTGSVYLNLYTSTDGVTWKKVADVNKGASGISEKNFSSAVTDTTHCVFLKIENTSTGSLNIQGIRILNKKDATEKEPSAVDPTPGPTPDPDPTPDPTPGSGDTDTTAKYKFTVKEIVPAAIVNGSTKNYSESITTQGGLFQFGNVSRIEASTISSTGYAVKLDGNASATNTKYILISLNTPLAAGDKITIGCYATSTPSAASPYGVSLYTDQAGAAFASVNCTKKNTEEALTINVTEAMAGVKEFYIVRNEGFSTFVSSITITGNSTGTDSIKAENAVKSGAIYDLSGRTILIPIRGQIYIKDKKTFIAQ